MRTRQRVASLLATVNEAIVGPHIAELCRQASAYLGTPSKPTHIHAATGDEYQVLQRGVMIESTWRPGVLYMNRDGVLIVRDEEEFFDGRFLELNEEGDVKNAGD